MRRAASLALAAVLGAAGCVYSPSGRCETAADCAAGEVCSAGVCVQAASDGGPAGVDPTAFSTVLWSSLAGQTGATFAVDSVGADLTGNVIVAGAVDAAWDFGPDAVATGAFVAKRGVDDGAALWAASFPTFAHGRLEATVLPAGDVVVAGTAFDPTLLDVLVTPDVRGTLVIGRIDAATGGAALLSAIDNSHGSAELVPKAVAVGAAGEILVVGSGSGDFGCAGGDTAGHTFAAALAADGSCVWSRGFSTRSISDVEAREDGTVAVAGLCTPPAGASFDPGGGTTCAKGLFVAVLDGADGSTVWARTTGGTGTVSAAHDVAVAPDGRITAVGDAKGLVDLGTGSIDFGPAAASFAATWDPSGVATALVRPIESPYGPEPDALAFTRCAYDRSGRLWLAGTYSGQPTLGGIRLSGCRAPQCLAAAFLAGLDAGGQLRELLPLRAAPDAAGGAFVDDLALFATSGTVAAALRFTGAGLAGGPAWTSAAGNQGDLGVLRIALP